MVLPRHAPYHQSQRKEKGIYAEQIAILLEKGAAYKAFDTPEELDAMLSLGFPLITYFHQIQYAVSYGSLVGGLVKSFAFGILVAGIGCQRGLQTKSGAVSVGESTTSAVVSGIILIALTDGVFSVVYYFLGV